MRKNILLLSGLVCSLFLIASCDKENKGDTAWKAIPSQEVTAGNEGADFTVNGVKSESGAVSVKAESASAATVTLNGIVPGYEQVLVPVSLSKAEEEGLYSFSGSVIMPEGPSILLKTKTSEVVGVYEIIVDGSISLEGKVVAKVNTAVTPEAKGTLEGTWKVNRVAPIENEVPTTGPVWVEWTVKDSSPYSLVPNIAKVASIVLGAKYANCLDEISLLADGNVTLKCWTEDADQDNTPTVDESGKNYIYGSTHDQWVRTNADNQAFWFCRDSYLYIVPNADVLSDASEGEDAITEESIKEVLQVLKGFGADVDALGAELVKIQKNGVAFKYDQPGEALKIYVDKAMCDPIVNALIPALPACDQLLEELLNSDDESVKQTAQSVKMALTMIGLEKPSDFATLWNDTVKFRIELNFTK